MQFLSRANFTGDRFDSVTQSRRRLIMDLFGESLYYGLGLACWAWAYLMPMRVSQGRPDYRWDLLGAAAAAVFAVAAGFALGWAYEVGEKFTWVQSWIEQVQELPWWGVVLAYVLLADFGA